VGPGHWAPADQVLKATLLAHPLADAQRVYGRNLADHRLVTLLAPPHPPPRAPVHGPAFTLVHVDQLPSGWTPCLPRVREEEVALPLHSLRLGVHHLGPTPAGPPCGAGQCFHHPVRLRTLHRPTGLPVPSHHVYLPRPARCCGTTSWRQFGAVLLPGLAFIPPTSLPSTISTPLALPILPSPLQPRPAPQSVARTRPHP
jgi:hypothetical protein